MNRLYINRILRPLKGIKSLFLAPCSLFLILCSLLFAPCSLLQAQLLYQISGNGAKKKSYLLATNALVDRTYIDSIPGVFRCYEQCNKVITEFTMQDYEAIAALRRAAVLPDSVILEQYYEHNDYHFLDDMMRVTLGMGMDKLCRLRPQYIGEMYRAELFKKWLGKNEDRAMDCFFEQVASQTNIPIYGLDNIGETMYMLFNREPIDYQCRELMQIVSNPEEEIRIERELARMYRRWQLTEMAYLMEAPDNRSSVSYSDYQVFARRNREWAKRLTPYLKDGACFITLPAIYLGGEKGLIMRLRDAGFRVKAVQK